MRNCYFQMSLRWRGAISVQQSAWARGRALWMGRRFQSDESEKQDRLPFREEREQRLDAWVQQSEAEGGASRSSLLYPPMKGVPTHTLQEYRERYDSQLEPGQELPNEEIVLCGRLYTKRQASKKLLFLDVQSNGGRVQVMASLSSYQPTGQALSFSRLIDTLNRGDQIGIVPISHDRLDIRTHHHGAYMRIGN